MIKALQISTAICNAQGNQLLVVMAVGEDGFVYQLVRGKWEQLPPLGSTIERPMGMIATSDKYTS